MAAVQQVNQATLVGSITQSGNAVITVTSVRMNNSPKSINVAVNSGFTASDVANATRIALAFDVDVSYVFLVSGTGANVVLTERNANANDTTLNIASDNGTCLGLTPEPTSTTTVQGDGLTHAYVSLSQVKNANGFNIGNDNTFDSALTDVINAVSREVEWLCNQRFWVNVADETRYFSPSQNDQCLVNDLVSITSLATDTNLDRTYATVWATTDYDLYPYDASFLNEPYWRVDCTPNGNNHFNARPYSNLYRTPYYSTQGNQKFVQIVGKFGWPAVPAQVQQATLLWCLKTWGRQATPLGIFSMSNLGQIQMPFPVQVPAIDPEIQSLLAPYILKVTGVI